MPEDSDSKRDLEVMKWLQVFQRVGRSFTGLLLLEIGWILLLALAAKLTEEGATPVLGIPGFLRLRRPFFEIANVPETTIWIVGALLILIGWTTYSRFSQYLVAPVVVTFKAALSLVFLLLWTATVATSVLLLPLTIPLERWRVRAWLNEHKRKWIVKNAPGPDVKESEARYAKWLEDYQRQFGPKTLENLALDEISLKPVLLLLGLRKLQSKFLIPIYSGIRVGVAPVLTPSRTQEIPVARLPFTNLAGLTVAVRSLLDELGMSEHVTYYTLPAHFGIATERMARFMRWFFGLDVLAWGGYLDEAGQVLWLKLQGRRPARSAPDPDHAGLQFEGRLFPGSYGGFKLQFPTVTFSSSIGDEAYHALLLAIFEGIRQRIQRESARAEKEWPKGLRWLQSTFHFFQDLLRPSQRWALSEVMERFTLHLVFDSFGTLPDEPAARRIIPSTSAHLSHLAGSWVGNQLCAKFSRSKNWWEVFPQHRFLEQLRWLSEKCSRTTPEDPDHLYRLGALSCALADKSGALQAFQQAGKLDQSACDIDRISACVLANSALSDADREVLLDGSLAIARFAAHAARAITSTAGSLSEIRKMMEESNAITFAKLDPAGDPAAMTAISVLDTIIEAVEQPTPGSLPAK